MNYQRKG